MDNITYKQYLELYEHDDGQLVEEIGEILSEEDFEQLDELSKKTLGSYIEKAAYMAQGPYRGKGAHSIASAAAQRAKNNMTQDALHNAQNSADHHSGVKNSSSNRDSTRDQYTQKNRELDVAGGKRVDGIRGAIKKLSGTAKVNPSENIEYDEDLFDAIIESILANAEEMGIELSEEQIEELSKKTLGSYADNAFKKYGQEHRLETDTKFRSAYTNDKKKLAHIYGTLSRARDRMDKRSSGIKNAIKKLSGTAKVNATESVSEDASSLKPNSMVSDAMPRLELFSAIIGAMNTMQKDDLIDLYNQARSRLDHEADEAPDASEKNKASVAMKSNMRESVNEILVGQEGLSEEFKDKMTTLFEAAVNSKIIVESVKLQEEIKEIEEEVLAEAQQLLDEAIEEIHEEYATKLDTYLDSTARDWLSENEVAIESTLRNEISIDFIDGLKTLFAEHYIDVPEDKVNVLEQLASKVEDLEQRLNEKITENNELRDFVIEAEKENVLTTMSEGLALTQKEKFKTLSEGIEFDGDLDSYQSKLSIVKENVFKNTKPKMSNLLEETFEVPLEESYMDPSIKAAMDVISRTSKK